ncbi:glycosyltransferase family 2 protein [Chitinophaga niabensis]|uniref:glycosyltransferase family 2 protein n=1 Tax=Chitinophaga niabensis TaxID=536979 RepID=UPI0031BAF5A2
MLISAFIPVFNEEKRIEHALISLQWCDEIVLLDKRSSDRTVEIAKQFGDKVRIFYMDNSSAYNPGEWDVMMEQCKGDWLIRFTASDVLHPGLAEDILKLIRQPDFKHDIINIPHRRFVLGLDIKGSPWFSKVCPMVFRKSRLRVDKADVHAALKFEGSSYTMPESTKYCMYHLTHENVDIMMERHLRYWRGEAIGAEKEDLKVQFKQVLNAFFRLTFIKRSFMYGWDGIMLAFAFITYQMMSFVYKWEKKRGNAAQVYQNIREEIKNDWEQNKQL